MGFCVTSSPRMRRFNPAPKARPKAPSWHHVLVLLAALALVFVSIPLSAQRPRMHTVVAGDTLARVARRYHATVEAIREANRIRGDNLRLGQELLVPREGGGPGCAPLRARCAFGPFTRANTRDGPGESHWIGARAHCTDAPLAPARARLDRGGGQCTHAWDA